MNTLTELLKAERVRFREHQEAWRLNNHAQAAEIERLKTELEELNLRYLLLLLRLHHHQTFQHTTHHHLQKKIQGLIMQYKRNKYPSLLKI